MKVLLIDSNYQIQNNASGQISRVFWESNADVFNPTIVCTKQYEVFKSNCRVISVPESTFIHNIGGLLRRIGLSDLCHIPDLKRFSWKPFVLRRINKELNLRDFNYIHSISCPESSHLIALELKKKTGLPWVAQFDDPWVENVNKKFKWGKLQKVDRHYEDLVAKNADIIIHSNKVIFKNWVQRYGVQLMQKASILPFSYNIPTLPRINDTIGRSGALKIFHIGNLYASRSAKSFFTAVKEFEKTYAETLPLDITFIGSLPETEVSFVESLDLKSKVSFLGVLSPDSLNNYYEAADVFLVIDMNLAKSASWPSKLMLYHYFRKPILSITVKDSVIEDDMISSGHKHYYFDDIKGISDYLYTASTDYDSLLRFDHNYWKQFTVENVTNLYLDAIKNIPGLLR